MRLSLVQKHRSTPIILGYDEGARGALVIISCVWAGKSGQKGVMRRSAVHALLRVGGSGYTVWTAGGIVKGIQAAVFACICRFAGVVCRWRPGNWCAFACALQQGMHALGSGQYVGGL